MATFTSSFVSESVAILQALDQNEIEAVVEVLAGKARQALRQTGLNRLAVGGGVAANRRLRQALENMVRDESAELFIPPLGLCTDNAAMAAIAVEKWRAGQFAPPDLDAEPTYRGAKPVFVFQPSKE